MSRCDWCLSDPLYVKYHDEEWGKPVHDDQKLFEMLILEGAQAGLSWITVLKKQDNYRKTFDNWDVQKIAIYDDKKIAEILANPGVIRNKLKINATVQNAKAFLALQKEQGSFDTYLWSFTGGEPIKNSWKKLAEIPAETELSQKISKDLKKRGFNFVGPTIIYAFLQAVGVVNDHLISCPRYSEV